MKNLIPQTGNCFREDSTLHSIKFIHTGDLHLGSPLKAVGKISPELQQSLLESTYKAITKLVDSALEHKVDFVLMAGDIYDNEVRSVKGNHFFAAQMQRLSQENIPVFIIYGNHDPIGKNIDYFKLPSNVRILGASGVEMCTYRDHWGRARARIIGQSYTAPAEAGKIHLHYQPPADGLINIALLHTGLNPGPNTYVPCSPEELKGQTAIDYWALGHIHSPTIINNCHPAIAYCGIPQGRDVGEVGIKGCLLVEMSASKATRIYFIPTSPIIWLTPVLSLDPGHSLHSIDDLADMLIQDCQKIIAGTPEMPPSCSTLHPGYEPEGYVVRWKIKGRNSIHGHLIAGNEADIATELTEMLNQHLTTAKPYLWTEGLKLHTGSPIPDLELLLKQDETVKTLEKIKTATSEVPELREKALSLLGNIWYKPRDSEDLRDDTFPVTDAKFSALLEDAFNMVLERIVGERESQ